MKKLLLILFLLPFIAYSCQDDLSDEQFEKFVMMVKNGYKEYSIELSESGEYIIPVSVGLNGTSMNKSNVSVRIGIDQDTLNGYNKDKHKNQTALYHPMFPLSHFTLTPSDSVITISDGSENASFDLKLQGLNNLNDKYGEYILPLSIKETSEYRIAVDKYSKLLIRILFTNSFSGQYNVDGHGTVTDITNGGETGALAKTMLAIGFNECYTFAGNVDARDENKTKFIINMRIDPGSSEVILSTPPSSDIDLKQQKGEVETFIGTSPSDNRVEIVTTVLDIEYTYTDKTNPEFPIDYQVKSKYTNEKTVYKK